jgi:hypothetical protein
MLFLENPLPVIAIGLLTVAILLSGFFKTGRVSILWAIAAVMGMTAALLAVEHFVRTPKEEIEGTLQGIAGDLARNDLSRVVSHISRTAPELRGEAERILPRLEIERATVKRNLECEFHGGDPPRATARFNAVLVVSDRRGGIRNQYSPFFFIVDFVFEDGTWKVVRYERHDPRHGPR